MSVVPHQNFPVIKIRIGRVQVAARRNNIVVQAHDASKEYKLVLVDSTIFEKAVHQEI